MTLKGNKGEWSELYTFLKLLADGRLYCGDGNLNRYDDKFYPILEMFRDDSPNRNTYKVQAAKNNILIVGETVNIEIPQERFKQEATILLEHIKDLDNNTDFSYLEPFMDMIDNHTVKAKSTDKADIRIVIHNLQTGSKPELGYSIKSKLGADSTLINSNKDGTNFIYKVQGLNQEQADAFNSFDKFKKKFNYLKSIGATVSYYKAANSILHNNLTLLDLGIERIIADSLIDYYSGMGRTIAEVTEHISKADPLNIINDTDQPMYAYKVKQFLLAFALGVTSTTPWYGNFHANGGYIVVKEDGEIICYHFFDRNDLENYLFYNTRFETPSTSRHNFGDIYKEKDEFFLKLNLQVRFK
ncbi:MAG: HpaII family restriction endonuclease [Muribaculaceae bacterium]|nr:HpaII family restriction endonuclease [Muribaculaceae bacterium]